MSSSSIDRFLGVTQRASEIAAGSDLETLLDHTLDLFIEVAHAEAGTLYIYDFTRDELVFRVIKGDPSSHRLLGLRIPADSGIVGAALRSGETTFIPNVADDPRWNRNAGDMAELRLTTMYCQPLSTEGRPVGVVQVFNLPADSIHNEEDMALLRFLGSILGGAIDKQRLLDEVQRREQRLSALMHTQTRLARTLDRNILLTGIMDYARELLDVEATSVWELEEQRGMVVLRASSQELGDRLKEVALPIGQGIIGHVVASGERVLLEDVQNDPRHNKQVEKQSGLVTRSMLSVPLRAPVIQLGPDRGVVKESVIGGAQALNKRDGSSFTQTDIELFEAFASQAATALQISRLYEGMQNLFENTIAVVANLVDARSPFTRSHSKRVSDLAVAIAKEMRKTRDEIDIYQIRIGGILHDVGKIGVADATLNKPGRLNDEERSEIERHPQIGFDAMNPITEIQRQLPEVLHAIIEHHERLDGRGYPRHLSAEEISLTGRIMAVADVFEAVTSPLRPYRAPMLPEDAIALLRRGAGTEFDEECVDALCRVWGRDGETIWT